MTNKVFTIVRKDSKIYFKNGNKGMQFLHIVPITPYGSNTYWSFRHITPMFKIRDLKEQEFF